MNTSGNKVLITGGASGIGFALAERFLAAGSQVIILGRSEDKLKAAQEQHPELITRQCDISDENDRLALFEWVKTEHSDVNVLINNAGVQRSINLTTADKDWSWYRQEIATNLDAPIHLSMLFAPFFIERGSGTIINVSSRLGLMPAAWVPIYTSTKSAVHFFTQSLRLQLEKTGVQVCEILPTMVNTSLAGAGAQADGINVDDFADDVMRELEKDTLEILYGNASGFVGDEYAPTAMRKMSHDFWERFSQRIPGFENLI